MLFLNYTNNCINCIMDKIVKIVIKQHYHLEKHKNTNKTSSGLCYKIRIL